MAPEEAVALSSHQGDCTHTLKKNVVEAMQVSSALADNIAGLTALASCLQVSM